jgi:uncharacterized membrane protein required for colicin V production
MYLDLLLLIFGLSFAIIGMWRGFTHQAISLLGILAIIFFSFPLAENLHQSEWIWLQQSPLLVLWAVSCFGIFLTSAALRWSVKRWIDWSPLGAMDRWMGLGLGAIKGLVIALMIGMGVQLVFEDPRYLSPDLAEDFKESKFLVASSDVLNVGIFGWSSAMTVLKSQIRPLKHTRLDDLQPWTE